MKFWTKLNFFKTRIRKVWSKVSNAFSISIVTMVMMNCFCGMVDRRKALSFISNQDHYQRSPPSRLSDMLHVGFEPTQNLSSGFVEWNCAAVITNTPWCHKPDNRAWQHFAFSNINYIRNQFGTFSNKSVLVWPKSLLKVSYCQH